MPRISLRSRVLAGGAAAALVAVAVSASPASGASGTTNGTSRPVRVTVFSPVRGAVAGKDGAGFVVDLALTARDKSANSVLSPEAGYQPLFNDPTAPTFQPGPNRGAPGLVVMLSSTPDKPGTPFHGPATNLAGLFQINGVGKLKGGLVQTWNTWQIGKAGFGSGRATLTAFVVEGTAPAVVPPTDLTLVSNVVNVPFTISRPTASAADASVKIRTDPALGDILVDAGGHTLYLFEKDQGSTSSCRGTCATTWPAATADAAPTVGAGLDASKIGSADGQLTYAGHLLYRYAADAMPGDAFGASVPNWDAVSPAGDPVHTG